VRLDTAVLPYLETLWALHAQGARAVSNALTGAD
jgi:hypothetical protein